MSAEDDAIAEAETELERQNVEKRRKLREQLIKDLDVSMEAQDQLEQELEQATKVRLRQSRLYQHILPGWFGNND